MTMTFDRRTALGLMLAPAMVWPVAGSAEEGDPRAGDVVLGDENAPVTVIEYASLTCPHCAGFHIQTWPEFKKNYVETGKVRFIMREVYFDQYGLWASMVARCGGHAGFYPMIDQYLVQQDRWSRAPRNQIVDEIRKIGRLNGLTAQAMDECLSDQEFAKELIANFQETASADNVEATPTFIINGDKASGNMTYAEFSALVDKYL